jgi:hypothetical protein
MKEEKTIGARLTQKDGKELKSLFINASNLLPILYVFNFPDEQRHTPKKKARTKILT